MCIATMRSITAAMTAQKVLRQVGIRVDIISLDSTLTKKGCAYGISFSCTYAARVRQVLDAKAVDYGELVGERE